MNYFDKLQQNIIREEFARAAMINRAKSVLNESQFDYFINELRNYEDNIVLTESNQGELKYEGLKESLVNYKGVTTLSERYSREVLLNKKLSELGETEKAEAIIKNKEMFPDSDELEAIAFLKAKYGNDFDKLFNEDGTRKQGNQKAAGGGEQKSAEEMAKDPKAKAAADKVEDQADAVEDKLENPKAKSIFSSIVDSYKYAFAANAKMWKNVFGFFTKAERSPPPRQDDMMMQLLMQLMQMMQKQNVPGEPQQPLTPQNVDVEQDGDDDGDGEEEVEEEGEEGGSIAIRKGKDSLQSRLAKLFPDLAKAKGTYYYRQTDKKGDQGRIISKNTSALAAILGDIEAQLRGSGIQITESQMLHLGETLLIFSGGQLLTEAKLSSFKGKIRQILQRVRDSEEDPKRRKKKIDKFLYRLRAYAEKGDMDKFASRYQNIKGASSIASQYATLSPEDQKKGVDYAKSYAQNQFMGDEDSVRGKAKGEAPASKSKEQMAKMVPKIKDGIVNISQIIGPKLRAAGYDLKSSEGQKVQQRLLKIIRRFLRKDLERLGLSDKVKLLAMFSKSKPKKGKMNESVEVLEEVYLDFFSDFMLKEIINELQNN